MTAALLVQLLIALGPVALDLAPKLAALWSKPELSVEEIINLCAPSKMLYEDYIAAARANNVQN